MLQKTLLEIVVICLLVCVAVNAKRICSRERWRNHGVNPIEENLGKVTFLYVLSRSNVSNTYQLESLNTNAQYWRHNLQADITVMAFAPDTAYLSKEIMNRYSYVRFYLETKEKFGFVSAYEKDALIYDKCGRLAYQFGAPYSFLGFPYVSDAVTTALRDDNSVCGACVLKRRKAAAVPMRYREMRTTTTPQKTLPRTRRSPTPSPEKETFNKDLDRFTKAPVIDDKKTKDISINDIAEKLTVNSDGGEGIINQKVDMVISVPLTSLEKSEESAYSSSSRSEITIKTTKEKSDSSSVFLAIDPPVVKTKKDESEVNDVLSTIDLTVVKAKKEKTDSSDVFLAIDPPVVKTNKDESEVSNVFSTIDSTAVKTKKEKSGSKNVFLAIHPPAVKAKKDKLEGSNVFSTIDLTTVKTTKDKLDSSNVFLAIDPPVIKTKADELKNGDASSTISSTVVKTKKGKLGSSNVFLAIDPPVVKPKKDKSEGSNVFSTIDLTTVKTTNDKSDSSNVFFAIDPTVLKTKKDESEVNNVLSTIDLAVVKTKTEKSGSSNVFLAIDPPVVKAKKDKSEGSNVFSTIDLTTVKTTKDISDNSNVFLAIDPPVIKTKGIKLKDGDVSSTIDLTALKTKKDKSDSSQVYSTIDSTVVKTKKVKSDINNVYLAIDRPAVETKKVKSEDGNVFSTIDSTVVKTMNDNSHDSDVLLAIDLPAVTMKKDKKVSKNIITNLVSSTSAKIDKTETSTSVLRVNTDARSSSTRKMEDNDITMINKALTVDAGKKKEDFRPRSTSSTSNESSDYKINKSTEKTDAIADTIISKIKSKNLLSSKVVSSNESDVNRVTTIISAPFTEKREAEDDSKSKGTSISSSKSAITEDHKFNISVEVPGIVTHKIKLVSESENNSFLTSKPVRPTESVDVKNNLITEAPAVSTRSTKHDFTTEPTVTASTERTEEAWESTSGVVTEALFGDTTTEEDEGFFTTAPITESTTHEHEIEISSTETLPFIVDASDQVNGNIKKPNVDESEVKDDHKNSITDTSKSSKIEDYIFTLSTETPVVITEKINVFSLSKSKEVSSSKLRLTENLDESKVSLAIDPPMVKPKKYESDNKAEKVTKMIDTDLGKSENSEVFLSIDPPAVKPKKDELGNSSVFLAIDPPMVKTKKAEKVTETIDTDSVKSENSKVFLSIDPAVVSTKKDKSNSSSVLLAIEPLVVKMKKNKPEISKLFLAIDPPLLKSKKGDQIVKTINTDLVESKNSEFSLAIDPPVVKRKKVKTMSTELISFSSNKTEKIKANEAGITINNGTSSSITGQINDAKINNVTMVKDLLVVDIKKDKDQDGVGITKKAKVVSAMTNKDLSLSKTKFTGEQKDNKVTSIIKRPIVDAKVIAGDKKGINADKVTYIIDIPVVDDKKASNDSKIRSTSFSSSELVVTEGSEENKSDLIINKDAGSTITKNSENRVAVVSSSKSDITRNYSVNLSADVPVAITHKVKAVSESKTKDFSSAESQVTKEQNDETVSLKIDAVLANTKISAADSKIKITATSSSKSDEADDSIVNLSPDLSAKGTNKIKIVSKIGKSNLSLYKPVIDENESYNKVGLIMGDDAVDTRQINDYSKILKTEDSSSKNKTKDEKVNLTTDVLAKLKSKSEVSYKSHNKDLLSPKVVLTEESDDTAALISGSRVVDTNKVKGDSKTIKIEFSSSKSEEKKDFKVNLSPEVADKVKEKLKVVSKTKSSDPSSSKSVLSTEEKIKKFGLVIDTHVEDTKKMKDDSKIVRTEYLSSRSSDLTEDYRVNLSSEVPVSITHKIKVVSENSKRDILSPKSAFSGNQADKKVSLIIDALASDTRKIKSDSKIRSEVILPSESNTTEDSKASLSSDVAAKVANNGNIVSNFRKTDFISSKSVLNGGKKEDKVTLVVDEFVVDPKQLNDHSTTKSKDFSLSKSVISENENTKLSSDKSVAINNKFKVSSTIRNEGMSASKSISTKETSNKIAFAINAHNVDTMKAKDDSKNINIGFSSSESTEVSITNTRKIDVASKTKNQDSVYSKSLLSEEQEENKVDLVLNSPAVDNMNSKLESKNRGTNVFLSKSDTVKDYKVNLSAEQPFSITHKIKVASKTENKEFSSSKSGGSKTGLIIDALVADTRKGVDDVKTKSTDIASSESQLIEDYKVNLSDELPVMAKHKIKVTSISEKKDVSSSQSVLANDAFNIKVDMINESRDDGISNAKLDSTNKETDATRSMTEGNNEGGGKIIRLITEVPPVESTTPLPETTTHEHDVFTTSTDPLPYNVDLSDETEYDIFDSITESDESWDNMIHNPWR